MPKEKKNKIKEDLLNLRQNLTKQNEHLYNLFLINNDDIIKAIDKFLKNQITSGQLNHSIELSRQRQNKVFKLLKWRGE